MNDEHVVTAEIEEATDAPVEMPERPEPFVYPEKFETERGEVINLPWPSAIMEVRVAKTVGEIMKLAPQLRQMFGAFDTATEIGVDTDAAAQSILGDIGDALSVAIGQVPEMVIELMSILTGLGTEEVGERMSIMGDGTKLVGTFFAKEMSRLGQASFNMNVDLGLKVPTLADVAANAADRGLTGEASDR